MLKKLRKEKESSGKSKYFDSRKSAFRAFKRDYNIPVSEHPEEVVKPYTQKGGDLGLDRRNIRLYIFEIIKNLFGTEKRKNIHLREDKGVFYGNGNQDSHFNGGIKDDKLRDHYYYKKKK